MASPWLVCLPVIFCACLCLAWFRKLMRNICECATCKHVPEGVQFEGETAEEAELHWQAVLRSSVGATLIFIVVAAYGLVMTRSVDSHARLTAAVEELAPSPGRLLFHALGAFMLIRGIFAECIASPLDGESNKPVICRKMGFPSYWTVQTQLMALFCLGLSAVGEAALYLDLLPSTGMVPALLVAAPYRFSIMATVQTVMVTLLFSTTMMGNDVWLENNVRMKERQGIPAGWHQVLSHYTLPVAIPDLLIVRRPDLLRSLGMGIEGNLALAVGHSVVFAGFILLVYGLTGHVQYRILLPQLTPRRFPMVTAGIILLQCIVVGSCWLAVEYTI